jgi:hypothetical protein
MSEFEVKDGEIIVLGQPGSNIESYLIDSEKGEQLVRTLVTESGRPRKELLEYLEENGPKEL